MKKKQSGGEIAEAAKRLLGFSSLRPGQEEAIRALVDKKDVVVVQPTGSGKSAIYQIAGALMKGSTVVVSPLIALQKDQADFIERSRLQDAAVVNSTLSASERRDALERIQAGEVEYIFLAPEQLRRSETLEELRAAHVSLFVIDEAHCISQWGHDFRPDYMELIHVREQLGNPPTLAMTATASNKVREEIIEKLGLRSPRVFVRGFDRPNISLRVDTFTDDEEKRDALLRRLEFAEGPGVIYAATRKSVEWIEAELREREIDALFYHGGLRPKQRTEIQDRFMRGEVPLIVATNAFGMGIDKADIRFVYHAEPSDSLDAYYQEIGRAGRDGKPAEAVLFYCARDISAQQYKTGSGRIERPTLDAVLHALLETRSLSMDELAKKTGLSSRKLANLIHKLEAVGTVRRSAAGQVELIKPGDVGGAAKIVAEFQKLQKETRKERLRQMQEYAECRTCRREYLLQYFGDNFQGPCGNCDRCTE
ncbi:MAG TPA: RecQ family ATP-dependent DNA helicase [Edaphobacter sp.]|nr:RecQ family ATP-dependent DNA helicase [Edaphobacter sp.]